MFISPPKFFVNWLIKRAKRQPIPWIYGSDGSLYMERYTLFFRDWMWIRLHITRRSDADPHLHVHPWRNLSWVLDGSYIEVVPSEDEFAPTELADDYPEAHRRERGDIIWRGLNVRHRLDLCDASDEHPNGRPCISLFITGRKQQSWGFWVNGTKVHWRDYLQQRDNLPDIYDFHGPDGDTPEAIGSHIPPRPIPPPAPRPR